jgi:hypothetical protein
MAHFTDSIALEKNGQRAISVILNDPALVQGDKFFECLAHSVAMAFGLVFILLHHSVKPVMSANMTAANIRFGGRNQRCNSRDFFQWENGFMQA